MIGVCESLLGQHGQRIQDAAERAFAAGKIAKDNYLAILAERKKHLGEGQ